MCDLLGPILAALIGGPLAALAFRLGSIGREVADHDARAVELDEDLRRWVRDRDRQLVREIRLLVNQAPRGVLSREPVPLGTEPEVRAHSSTLEPFAASSQPG